MKIKLLAISALALALTGCGHSAKSHFDKKYRPISDQPYFKTKLGGVMKLALGFAPTSGDIILDDKGIFNITDNSYVFEGNWDSDDKGEGLFGEQGQAFFYFTEKGDDFCVQGEFEAVPICNKTVTYSEVEE